MRVVPTALPDVLIVEPRAFGDARGALIEMWSAEDHARHQLLHRCDLDLVSISTRGVVRGLHHQHPHAQAKLVSVLEGEIYDVAVDLRRGSPSFARWTAVSLSSENRRQLFLPAGFAHGFAVLSERAVLHYKLSEAHHPESERGVVWNDPELGIDWPISAPILSPRDTTHPRLREIPPADLPSYEPPHHA